MQKELFCSVNLYFFQRRQTMFSFFFYKKLNCLLSFFTKKNIYCSRQQSSILQKNEKTRKQCRIIFPSHVESFYCKKTKRTLWRPGSKRIPGVDSNLFLENCRRVKWHGQSSFLERKQPLVNGRICPWSFKIAGRAGHWLVIWILRIFFFFLDIRK